MDIDMEDINDDEEENPLVEHDGSDGSDSEFEEVIDIHEGVSMPLVNGKTTTRTLAIIHIDNQWRLVVLLHVLGPRLHL